ncbi:MAG: hypothetical protein ACLQUY_13275 [Ktedonobacterales bacterium]
MVLAEAPWLHTLGEIAGVILVLELSLALIITCAFMVALAIGARWLHEHAIPPLREYLPRAEQAMTITEHGSDSLVHGIAEFYGRRQAVGTGLRVLLFGKNDLENFREEQQVYVDEELQRIEPPQDGAARSAPAARHNANNRRGADTHVDDTTP